MFLVLLLCLFLKTQLSNGADSIAASQSLSGDQTIVSKGGVFKLGFFRPGKSSKTYMGMWYNKVYQQNIVWVGNRETPISDRFSSELKILDGNLVLLNESKIPIWSTNLKTTSSLSSVHAVLEDSGNLVLRNGSNNSTELLWQSFDHPTHTWLAGSKMGYDRRMKINRRLTSWKNPEDPAPGDFSIELDPDETNQFFLMWKRSVKYWTPGTWDGHTFSDVPEMKFAPFNHLPFTITYISNETETSFIYTQYDPSALNRFSLDVSGQVKFWPFSETTQQFFLLWSEPRQQCDVYAFCGAFGSCNEASPTFCSCLRGFEPKSQSDWNFSDHSGGCRRKTPLQCESITAANWKRDMFFASSGMIFPDHAKSVAVGSGEECKTACLNNCSCTAYAYDKDGCSIWFGDLLNLKQLGEDDHSSKTLYIKLAASELLISNYNNGMIVGIVVGSIAGVVVLLGLVLFYVFRRRRSVRAAKGIEGSLVAFSYRDLQNATKNFSEKLGGGGFGSVFKGTLPDSTAIAVKKLESISQGEKQFRTEVRTIGTIQHVNLVRLRGFCSEGNKKLLVYEHMPNGSLDANLFHVKDSKVPDWKTRYQIALGTAKGLHYLHEKCRDCIIHCDIKPENILLDAKFHPKVADFGLAKLVGHEFSRVLTTMRGTRGYLAPEWISGVAITAKADVYSYGMMLLEVISGRRNTEQSDDGKIKFFPTFAANQIIRGEDILSLLDSRLEGDANEEELTRLCKVACWCIQDHENHRPSMAQVVQILEGNLDVNLPPIPRYLQVYYVDNQEQIIFFTESSSSQSSKANSNSSIAS